MQKPEDNMDARKPSQPAIVKPDQAVTIKSTHAAGEATEEAPPVLHAAIGLAEQIRVASDEIEWERRIPAGRLLLGLEPLRWLF
jgi:hypothetical protein